MKIPRQLLFVITTFSWITVAAYAGTIVPYLNDFDAQFASSSSVANAATPSMTLADGLTMAAEFTPNAQDLASSATGAVQVLEMGGTTSGSGLWIINSNITFVTKSGAAQSYSTNLDDLDGSDNTLAYSFGTLTAGTTYKVWASFNTTNSQLLVSFDNTITPLSLNGVTASWNWMGNGGIDFGGLLDVPGRLGGLCDNTASGIFYRANAVALSGTAILGQIFNQAVDTNSTPPSITMYQWAGSVNADWDINTTPNWNNLTLGANSVNYQEGSGLTYVVFDDNGGVNPDVNLTTVVQPAAVIYSNNATLYSLNGPGKISGAASLNMKGSGYLTVNMTNDYTGGTLLQNGTLVLGVNNALPVTGVLTIGGIGTCTCIMNGFNQTLGGLVSGSLGTGAKLLYNGAPTPVTLTLNVPSGTAAFYRYGLGQSGNDYANNFSVVKNGGGEQRLGISFYTGTTVVNGGTLLFTAPTDYNLTNTVTVNAGATLGGPGTVGAPIILNDGSTLSPGLDAIGTLTLTNDSLTMSSGTTNWFEINNDNAAHDVVAGIGQFSITYAGTLVLTNIGANSFTGTETFQLFDLTNTATINGNFSGVTILPATGATGTFDSATGILTITAPSIPTTPTNLDYAIGGGYISLSWPTNYLGWSLQVQTNTLAVGLSTNWETVTGSSLVTSTNFPLQSSNEAVFYRMFYKP